MSSPHPPAQPPSTTPGVFHNYSTLSAAVTKWNTDQTLSESIHGHVSGWDTSRVEDMHELFAGIGSASNPFNDDISAWDVSRVETMSFMFDRAENFNQELNAWDVSRVTNMNSAFYRTILFDQELQDWDVSKVGNMGGTFSQSNFNKPLGQWDTSEVTTMFRTFWNAISFNQRDIRHWDVGKVNDFNFMFLSSALEGDECSKHLAAPTV